MFIDVINTPRNFFDWIMEVSLKDNFIFIIFAHNKVLLFDWTLNQIITSFETTEKCILYSALFLSIWNSDFVIAAGTVFTDIILWSSLKSGKVLQRLKGHEGVIFSLSFESSLQMLASASDDRSIRVWKNNAPKGSQISEFWENCNFDILHVLYSHEARIWKVDFFQNLIISCGEDSSVCLWNAVEGRLEYKEVFEKGIKFWNLAIDKNDQVAFIGGSGSTLIKCDFSNLFAIDCKSFVNFEIFPNSVEFFEEKLENNLCLYLTCPDGIIGKMTINSKQSELAKIGTLQSYSVMWLDHERGVVLIGSHKGVVLIVRLSDCRTVEKQVICHQNKIFNIFSVCSDKFLTSSLNGEIKLWSYDDLSLFHTVTLPDSRHRWPTTGRYTRKEALIIGDRNGSIFVYFKDKTPSQCFKNLHGIHGVTDIKERSLSSFIYTSGRDGKVLEFYCEQATLKLLRVFRVFSNMDWIGKMLFDSTTDKLMFIVGFHGSYFKVWSEVEQGNVWSVECGGGHRPWAFFNSKSALSFAYVKQGQLFYCHKNFDKQVYDVKPSDNNSNLFETNPCHDLIQSHTFHTKTIRSSHTLLDKNRFGANIYICFAGEDNIISLNSVDSKSFQFKTVTHLHGHVSCVKAMASYLEYQDERQIVKYLVTVGGRSQLIVWQTTFLGNQVLCQQVVCSYLWSLDGKRCKTWKTETKQIDVPQVRYMDVDLVRLDECYFIFVACSDAMIRIFRFDKNQLYYSQCTMSSNNCLLNIRLLSEHIFLTGSTDGCLRFWQFAFRSLPFVESGHDKSPLQSTVFDDDKKLENSSSSELLTQLRCHQSGINATDTHLIKGF